MLRKKTPPSKGESEGPGRMLYIPENIAIFRRIKYFFDRTKDCGLPVEWVVAYGPCAALAGRVITDVLQFFVDSFQGHDLQISNHWTWELIFGLGALNICPDRWKYLKSHHFLLRRSIHFQCCVTANDWSIFLGADQKGIELTRWGKFIFPPNKHLLLHNRENFQWLRGSGGWGILIVVGTARQGDGGTAIISWSLALFKPGPAGTPVRWNYFLVYS